MNKNVNELLNLSPEDILRMSRKELAEVTSILASAGNKRLRRLEKAPLGTESFAYQNVQKSVRAGEQTKFSVKGKTLNQLRNEYASVRNFLKRKTSSVSGWKKEVKKIKERVGFKDSSGKSLNDFFKLYRKLEELNPSIVERYGSTETQRLLNRVITQNEDLSDDEILDIMNNEVNQIYENMQKYEMEDDEYDEFDDLFDE